MTGLACREPLAHRVADPATEQLVPPPCDDPAPLLGTFDHRAPGYIVAYHDGVDAQGETARLAAAYGFVPENVYQYAIRGFSADLTPQAVAGVRCESTVRIVEHDVIAHAT